MALYPTPTGHRMAYDRDGSTPFKAVNGVITNWSGSVASLINSERPAALTTPSATLVSDVDSSDPTYIGVVFPELRDLAGYFITSVFSSSPHGPLACETSVLTTNGLDGGDWTSRQNPWVDDTAAVTPDYRSSVQALSVAGIKAVRFRMSVNPGGNPQWYLSVMHLYGQPSSGQNPDSLRIWQPVTAAEVTTVFDFGDIARGSAATQTFRVHNQSATKTASTITVGTEALTDASPTLIGQYQLSTDNITFTNSISIPNLGPGATSAALYVKDTVSPGAATSVWSARLVAAAGTFA